MAKVSRVRGRNRCLVLVALAASLTLLALVAVKAPAIAAAASPPFQVDHSGDRVDSNVGDGVCRTSAGTCTLRAAIQEANFLPGADEIKVPGGVYRLAIPPDSTDPPEPPEPVGFVFDPALFGDYEGDYDVVGPLTITGAGAGSTILDGGSAPFGSPAEQTALDRLLEIHPNAGDVTVSGVTFRNGWSESEGGAIWNGSAGKVRLADVVVRDSVATDYGGGIYSGGPLNGICILACPFGDGRLELVRTTLTGNETGGKGGGVFSTQSSMVVMGKADSPAEFSDNLADEGAAMYNGGEETPTGSRARVEVNHAKFTNNTALADGGAILNEHEGDLAVTDSAFSHNLAWGDGGAVDSGSKTSASLTRATFSNNRSGGEGGAVNTHAERPVTVAGGVFKDNEAGADLVDELGELHEGEGGGGGLAVDGTGGVSVVRSEFEGNSSVEEGGALAVNASGTVVVRESDFNENETETSGGAILNAGLRVTFSGLTINGNEAREDGGGIDNQGSGEFVIEDTTISRNTAFDGGGVSNRPDALSRVINSTLWNNRARNHGGGFLHKSDAATEIENTTVSGNTALVNGGGLHIDADGGLRVVNTTITLNTSPAGSGVGKTIESVNFPIVPSLAAIFRNSIVAGNRLSADCNDAWASEGGNVDGGSGCHFRGPRDRTNINPRLDAIADNGGPTMTHEPQPDSHAIDGGLNTATRLVDGTTGNCPETDQRGVTRPQNGRCDIGAHEYEGPFPPPDTNPPETKIDDDNPTHTGEIAKFRFSGTDDVTPTDDLSFECRILNEDPTEPPEPVDPTEPVDPLDPELMWHGCSSPWPGDALQLEDGPNRLEVRAIDRAGNVDPTPDVHEFVAGEDITPPQTILTGTPPKSTTRNSAVFGFAGIDDVTDPSLIEFECRIDGGDWEAVECLNPMSFSNLTIGEHTFQVRAIDEGDNIDPTPATYTWTVESPSTCDEANITLGAAADSYVDEMSPLENFGIAPELSVRSQAPGENARALVRFGLPTGLPDCELTSARLRLFTDGEAGRTLEAVPIAEAWSEVQVTWNNQPDTTGTPATTASGSGYREWNVTQQVEEMLAGGPSHGFLVRDASEDSADGAEQTISSRDTLAEPPEVPKLVLRFAGGSSTPPPPPPSEDLEPTRVECGQVLTESTRVLNDLSCDLGDALVVGAPNIVVDLDGHTIDGPDFLLSGEEDGLPAGIRNIGHENVVIRNGTVQQFGNGVALMAGARFNLVHDLTLQRNALAGVELWDADDGRNGNEVRDNVFSANAAGVALLSESENSVVADNLFEGDVGVAVHVVDSSENRIVRNEVTGVPIDPNLDSDAGILLEGATDNVLSENTIAESGDGGVILAMGSHRNRVEGNVMSRTGDAGISVEDSEGNELVANVAHLASDAGIVLNGANDGVVLDNDVRFNPGGVALAGSSGNLVKANNANGNDGIGVELASGSLRNRVIENSASNTADDGVVVEGSALDQAGVPADGNLIEGNRTNGNASDGIVADAGHTLTDNAAHNNAGWGIQGAQSTASGAGVIDGGGNTASGNGEPEQCTGVVCGPGTPPTDAEGPDVTAPDTVITEKPSDGASGMEPQVFRFTGTDDVAPPTALRFECRLDPPPDPVVPPEEPEPPEPGEPPEPPEEPVTEHWEDCASPVRIPLMLSGEHHFEVRAIDPSDNVDATPAVHTWTVSAAPPGPDSTPPRTTITEGPSDPSTSRSATFRFRASDDLTPGPDLVYECRLDGDGWEPCASPATYHDLDLGDHEFEVRAIDVQGNRDPAPPTHGWTIEEPPADENPPDTTIDSTPDRRTVETDATFAFSSDEEGATFECQLDGGAWEPCESPAEYSGLTVDEHTFRVRAVDQAGNRDETPASYTWTVAPPPVSRNVTCGEVVTESVRVTNHLVDCPGDGLVIGAHGITVDLNGRTLDGSGLGAGVRNDGFDSVTVTGDGQLQEFDYGVQLNAGTADGIVSDVTVQQNQEGGIQLSNADDGTHGNTVRRSLVTGNSVSGIAVVGGTENARLVDNNIGRNPAVGVRIAGSRGARLDRNRITASSEAGVLLEGASGNALVDNVLTGNSGEAVAITLASNDNRLERNEIKANSKGVVLRGSNGNELIDNLVNEISDKAISLEAANGNLLRGNDVTSNSTGISVYQSVRNRLEENDVSENSSSGIWIGDLSYENKLVLNKANANDSDGIMVEVEAPPGAGTLLDRNTANGNDSDGISVNKVGHTLVGNTANNNLGWGIYASVPTALGMNVDGGKNRAVGNKELEQCFGIRCDGGDPVRETFPPDTMIDEGPAEISPSDSASFRFSGSDNSLMDVDFECRVDGGAFQACVSPREYEDLEEGPHTFEVRAVDWAGNVDPTPARYEWTYEPLPPGVAPETTITSGPDRVTVSKTATFRLSSNEPGVSFACSLDGADFEPCDSPKEYTGLEVGEHVFEARATDAEGNVDESPARHTWKVVPPPEPATVSCGEVVTESVKLTNSLTDCPGDGLVVGVDEITVDLNGHTIDGVGVGVGIRNSRFDGVTVTNGTVQEFEVGVDIGPSTWNVVSSVTAQVNGLSGIQLSGADDATARANTVTSNEAEGIALLGGAQRALVRDNTVSANEGRGIWLESSSGNRIERNSVVGSGDAGVALEGAANNTLVGNDLSANAGGIDVLTESRGNHLERNTVTAGEGGIQLVESNGVQVLDNLVQQTTSSGITLDAANDALVRRNDLRFNSGGIELSDSSGNRITANNASGTTGTGIGISGNSVNNAIVQNSVSSNGSEGIAVEDLAPAGQANRIDRNTASSNGGDGILVSGSGHVIVANVANMNDGWGIYAEAGNEDGGGNLAAGNVEPEQCFGVVCEPGDFVVPGLPDTTILDRPPDPSSSRNASFTFIGEDDTTALADLDFECRLDSQDPLAWEECENPQEYTGLSPGEHTFEVRAVDLAGNVDPTPASYTWTYEPLAAGVPPDTEIRLAPPARTPLLEALFTFTSNEPDVTFECQLDGGPWEPCEFAYEAEFEETDVGPHEFQVRAIDLEGNVDPTPAVHSWTITGLVTTVLSGPAFEPGEGGDPASGGETDSTSATFDFAANIGEATFECSLDLGPFTPCTSPVTYDDLAVGDHIFRVTATDPEGETVQVEPTEYEWTVIPPADTTPPDTTIDSSPPDGSSDTTFTFSGTDDQTPRSRLTFECRLDSTDELDWYECTSPHNLLEEIPAEEFAPGEHTFEVRAIDDAEPTDPAGPEGNADPTPARYTWTSVADATAPETRLLSGPSGPTIEIDATFEFDGRDNATPDALLEFECSLDGAAFDPCDSPHDVQGLDPGEHTLRIRAVDLALNADPTPVSHTWRVIGSPETTIDSAPGETTSDTTARFEFSSDQSDSTFACSFNGGAFEACTSPSTYDVGGSGTYTFEVQATNSFGLVDETPATHEWTVDAPPDTDPPDTTIHSQPDQVTTSTDATFTFSADQTGSTFECQLDGNGFGDCSSPHELTGLAAGEHTFEVRATDPAGNVDLTPASYTWEVDGPPVSEILSGPDEETESTSATFTFESSDPGSTFECWLDGVIEQCTSPKEYTDLSVGEHEFAVRATDPQGNVEAQWVDYEWTIVPVAAPETTMTNGPALETVSRGATFEFSADEPGSTFECSLDAADFENCESPVEYSDLEAGEHTLEVRATDRFGNRDETPASYTWTILGAADLETEINSGPQDSTIDQTARFGFSANVPGVTFECSLDGSQFEACESPTEYGSLDFGEHTFEVRALDGAGEPERTPASRTWTVVGPPETTIDSAPDLETSEPDARFEFSADQSGSTFECSLDGADFAPCTSPVHYADVGGGAHAFEVRATNPFGLVDETPAAHEWTVDGPAESTPPDTTITSKPPARTSSTNATFEFSGTDNRTAEADLEFECSLDGAAFASCSSPHELSDLAPGEHTLEIRAVDEAGNVDPTPASHSWTVEDVVPPETTIDSGPDDPTQSTSAAFEFSADEPDVTFECSLDAAQFESCTSPHEIDGLEVGNHRFDVRARDASGNADPTPDTYRWTIEAPDTTPPDTTILSEPAATSTSSTATFRFTASEVIDGFECSLDGEPFADCESPHELQGLSDGEHTFEVRAIDLADNVDPTPARSTWTVDATAPDTTIGSKPDAQTTSTSARFSFSADEPGSSFECARDEQPFGPCQSPHDYSGLAAGEHEFRVRAVDPAGNSDASPATYRWTISPPGCTSSTVTRGAAVDSWILQDSASQNYRTDSILKVDTKSGANARALVRFDLPTIPSGCQVTSAKLRLYASSYKQGRTLQALRLAAPWSEGGVTWNNQPATTGAAVTTTSGSGYREWTVTSQVQSMYSGSNHGFLVRDATEGGTGLDQGFHSREKGTDNPPRLVITFG